MFRLEMTVLLFGTIACTPVGAAGLESASGAYFAISAADAQQLSDWYRQHLAFAVVKAESPRDGVRLVILKSAAGMIEIVQLAGAKPPPLVGGVPARHQVQGVFKIGFAVPDVAAVHAEMKRQGVAIAHDMMSGSGGLAPSFSVRDAEGNLVQFVQQ